jgi:hypothetical protein
MDRSSPGRYSILVCLVRRWSSDCRDPVWRVEFFREITRTFMRIMEDSSVYWYHQGEYGVVEFHEGIFFGYRHLDKKNIEPLFPSDLVCLTQTLYSVDSKSPPWN